jgi:hypothetical protein
LTLVRKKQVLAAGLIGFTLWPLAQMELVRCFGICPWKLGGWGMYATPRISPGISILVQRGDEAPAPMAVVPPGVRVSCENFQTRRLWLRDLVPPDEIGRLVLASNRDYQRATILILQPVLDTTSGMVRTEEKAYHYDRRATDLRRESRGSTQSGQSRTASGRRILPPPSNDPLAARADQTRHPQTTETDESASSVKQPIGWKVFLMKRPSWSRLL